jgi:hypothetical protein
MFDPLQTLLVDADTFTEGAEATFTTIVKLLLVAVALEEQVALDVKPQVTISPLDKVEDENEFEFVPTFVPFKLHWNTGVEPPLVIDAVNVADTPEQMLGVLVDTDIVGVTVGVMIIVTLLDVAVEAETHEALDVITQETTSLFTNADEE